MTHLHALPWRFSGTALVATLVILLGGAIEAGAQTPARGPINRPYASRADLEALLAKVPPSQEHLTEVQMLRRRLHEGDFEVGDRIALWVQGVEALSDTFPVKINHVISIPTLPDISLRGVLRSELEERLTEELGRFVNAPTIRAEPLMRVAVLGEVARPGFYYVPAQDLLSEVIMRAGGPTGNTDLSKSEVTRANIIILTKEEVQQAVVAGTTLDRLNLIGGDEIQVGKKGGGIGPTLAIVGSLSGVVFSIVALRQIF